MSFVEIPAEKIRERLNKAGFVLTPDPRSGEEIYQRAHHKNPHYLIKIYSTISTNGYVARDCGKDAIRVVVVFNPRPNAVYPVWKGKRVYRTGTVEAVLERMIERAREGYAFVNTKLMSL